jgi:adenylosuccinate lyase
MSEERRDVYVSPFVTRWASRSMLENWSDVRKFCTWRRLWIALAEAQRELGLDISEEQISELRAHADEVDFDAVAAIERQTRHDVMAHVRAYGEQCPRAAGIIHLGATSAFVGDNADLVLIRDALTLLAPPLATACRNLVAFARKHKDLPCLAYTHFQPAQLRSPFGEPKAPPAPRPATWLSSTATTRRSSSSTAWSLRRWGSHASAP